MKILQVIPYFCFGGAETMCENLTYALRDLGHDVVVVSLFDERTEISDRHGGSRRPHPVLKQKAGAGYVRGAEAYEDSPGGTAGRGSHPPERDSVRGDGG